MIWCHTTQRETETAKRREVVTVYNSKNKKKESGAQLHTAHVGTSIQWPSKQGLTVLIGALEHQWSRHVQNRVLLAYSSAAQAQQRYYANQEQVCHGYCILCLQVLSSHSIMQAFARQGRALLWCQVGHENTALVLTSTTE